MAVLVHPPLEEGCFVKRLGRLNRTKRFERHKDVRVDQEGEASSRLHALHGGPGAGEFQRDRLWLEVESSDFCAIMNVVALAPSIRTRQLFREFLVGTVLRYIDDVFTGAGIRMGSVPPEQLPSGQRRSLVEEYYAGVDWSSPHDVNKVLRAYEHILFDAAESDEKERLIKALRLDGFTVNESGRISPPASLDLGIDWNTLDDPDALAGYERRILENVETDPELAIGSSKELVEATCKLLLEDAGVEPDTSWTAEQLFKNALKTIDLSVDDVPDAKAGAESVKKVLRGMHQAVVGTAELRNRFGTGHGRHRRSSGLSSRHARLVAAAALSFARFLLDTRVEKRQRADRGAEAA